MKFGRRLNVLFLLVAMPFAFTTAQDFKADVKKMYAVYRSSAAFYTEMKTKVFASKSSKEPVEVVSSVVKRQGRNYFHSWEGNSFVVNAKYSVMVVERAKTITFQSLEGKKPPPMRDIFPSLDSMLLNYKDKVEYKGIVNGQKFYQIIPKDSWMNKIEMFIDTESHWIKKLTYWFDDKATGSSGRVETTFLNTDTSPVFPSSTFSETQYFVKEGKKFKPSAKYKGYEVLNENDFEDDDEGDEEGEDSEF